MKLYRFIFPFILSHKWFFLAYFILSLIIWGLSLYNPYLVGIFVDAMKDISVNTSATNSLSILHYLFLSWGIQVVVSFLNGVISSRLFIRTEFDVKNNIFMHLKQLPLSFLGENSSSYYTQLINNDSKALTDFVIQSTFLLITTFMSLCYILVYMSKLSIQMTGLIISLIPIYFLSYFCFKKPLYKTNLVFKENQNKFFAKMNHQLLYLKYLKIHGLFKESNEEISSGFKPVFSSEMKYVYIKQGYTAVGNLSRFLINIVIFSYSAREILRNNMTLGTFTMINTYSSILISNISYTLSYGSSYQNALVAYNRLQKILTSEVEQEGKMIIDTVEKIDIKNLHFAYNSTKKIINDINFSLSKGKLYVLSGQNGAGKSTLYSLLIGLVHGFDGVISINDICISDINMSHFRKEKCAVVLQEPDLYYGSIRENLNIVNEDFFYYLSERLNFSSFLHTLQDDIDFSLTNDSSNISGGEKQKIAIISALNKNAELVILDEPTSALDQNSIYNLYRILEDEKQNKIIIIITHNSDIVSIADEVLNIA